MSGKRAWFQIHLSTAMVMMIIAGGLLWLNIHPRYGQPNMAPDSVQYWGTNHPGNYDAYGWPMGIVEWVNAETGERSIVNFRYPMFGVLPIAVDFFLAILILFAVSRCVEYIVRRREGRAP